MGKYSLRTVLVSPFGGQFELDWLLVVVMPEADFMGGIYAEARQTVIICIGILLLSLLFGIVYSARLSKPIQALTDRVCQVQDFKLDNDFQVRSSVTEDRGTLRLKGREQPQHVYGL